MLVASIQAVAALPLAEHNPAHHVRPDDSANSARLIVKFKADSALLRKHALAAQASASDTSDAVQARANSLGQRLGINLRGGRALTALTQVISADGIKAEALAQRLRAQADVEYAVIDQRRSHFALPNDPLFAQGPPVNGNSGGPVVGQWYLQAPNAEIISSINATGAWDLSTGSANIVVAVLDTGVRPEHPDLGNRLLPGYDMISDLLAANDGSGRDADASDPGDWLTRKESNSQSSQFYQCGAEDSSWHGTMTASLIGATANNGVGMAGVAWGVKLLPVRVLGKCGGYDSDIIAGIQWAAGLVVPGVPVNPTPARVINMSLGSAGACDQSYIDAINAITNKPDPTIIVASAGNSSGHAVGVPANCPGVIAVAGLRHVGTKVGYSDLGPEITISAPAGNCVNTDATSPCLYPILAATNTGLTTPLASSYTDAFNASVGTSFSAPLVAGTVALMLSIEPGLTTAQVKSTLQKSARAFPGGPPTGTVQNCVAPNSADQLECYCTTTSCGAGMLDAAAAVARAKAFFAPQHLDFVTGWNLSGSVSNAEIDVAGVFGDASRVESVWKWVAPLSHWALYQPSMQAQALSDYAKSKGYEVLTTINGNEGFWLKARLPFSVNVALGSTRAGVDFAETLQPGWSLISIDEVTTPRQFNDSLGTAQAPPEHISRNVISLWAWDSARLAWYFYAPDLNATQLAAYAASKAYLDFTSLNKTLGPGTGFWLNKP